MNQGGMMSKKAAAIFLSMVILLHTDQSRADDTMTILDVYDNLAYQGGLRTDHGFSCLIRGTEKTILFDTGAHGRILLANLEKLNIDPGLIDIVVLSHIHWDHIGGLHTFLEKNPRVTLYVPKSFMKMSDFIESMRGFDPQVIAVTDPQPICRDVYSTGMMGARLHEQSLVIRTEKGSIVITGCAHPGIVEIVKKSKEVVKGDTLLVMGGFHLLNQDHTQVEETVRMFKEMGVHYVGPCHCTGDMPIRVFRERYQDYFIEMGVGRTVIPSELKN